MQWLYQPSWLHILGWALFNSIWQMSAMWLVYLLFVNLNKKTSAGTRYFIGVALLFSGSLWFFLSLVKGFFISNEQIVSQQLLFSNNPSGPYSLKTLFNNAIPFATIAYLVVFVFLVARYARRYMISCRIKTLGLLKPNIEIRVFIKNMMERIGIEKQVKIWLSASIQIPMVIGFLKPVILIPLATINHLSPAQMEAVLLHELAHIKRNDYLINLILVFVETIFFFNPFALILMKTIRRERENACDDIVLQFRYDPRVYASALLSLEKERHTTQQLAMAAIGKSKKLLLQRVIRITKQNKTNEQGKSGLVFLLFFGALFALISISSNSTNNKVNKPIEPTKNLVAAIRPMHITKINLINQSNINSKKEKPEIKGILPPKKSHPINEEANDGNGFVLTNDNEDEGSGPSGSTQAIFSTSPDDYTISLPTPASVPPSISMDKYPYVPTESFTILDVEDSSIPKPLLSQTTDAVTDANLSMEKTLSAINKMDWGKIQKSIGAGKVDIAKLQKEIKRNIKLMDWNKINQQVTNSLNNVNEKRLENDIQVQMKALQNIKWRDQQKAKDLQQQILIQQLRLQKIIIQKQQEQLRMLDQQMHRNLKIVYI